MCPSHASPRCPSALDLVEDLARRDFTVNALALRLPEMELVDPFDGLGDLASGRLRTPLDPEVSFGDDPLRMLRAARFAARFSLTPDPALVAAIGRMHGRLAVVSAERIRDELDKMMMLDVPSEALWFVVRTGLAAEFLPELPASLPRAGSRSTVTRTCWPTRWQWSTRRRRTGCCVWPPCSTTSANHGRGQSPTEE